MFTFNVGYENLDSSIECIYVFKGDTRRNIATR